MYAFFCALVFLAAYLVNILTISVGYHRGLAHGAVTLRPRVARWVVRWGNWLTGLDPKAWTVMHRMHHAYSDTEQDPHTPRNTTMTGMLPHQLKSYKRVIVGLLRRNPAVTKFAQGLDFDLNWLNKTGRWWLPYALHVAIGASLSLAVGGWLIGFCYVAGMMSHPIQGGLVNYFGHKSGSRNFDTQDDSRNNHPVAWVTFGEGFQNNHHRYPASAKFSYRWYEVDLGYAACVAMERLRWLRIEPSGMIPRPGRVGTPDLLASGSAAHRK